MTPLEWDNFKNKFLPTGYATYDKHFNADNINVWDLPLDLLNPQMIMLILDLNKRVNHLEEEIKELRRK